MSTTVKHFHSAMTGAPTLNGTAGSLIAVLDACLVDGFGLKTADSVVVSGGIATANFSTGHSFEPDVIALFAGATPAGLNGEKRVLTTSTNTVTFDATGISDQTATGTITAKLAPVGWEKPFSGTNLAAYRSGDVTSTRMFLRVDDTNANNARVVCYESMTDVNTGTAPFPTSGQISGGGYWGKANDTSATARAWTLIADAKTFWLHMHTALSASGASGCIWGFGDFESYKSSDPYACKINAASSAAHTQTSNVQASAELLQNSPSPTGDYAARSFTGLGGSSALSTSAEGFLSGSGPAGAFASAFVPIYPNGPNNGLVLVRKVLVEAGVALRGAQRGMLYPVQICNSFFNWRDKIEGQGSYLGRKLLAVKCGSPAGVVSQGVVFFDITGPWG